MPRDNLRKARVFFQDIPAGILEEVVNGYRFTYDPEYIKKGRSISLSLDLQERPYGSTVLFPFFVGLIPEGWYKEIVCATKKIDPNDEFGILLVTGESTIGAVTLKDITNE